MTAPCAVCTVLLRAMRLLYSVLGVSLQEGERAQSLHLLRAVGCAPAVLSGGRVAARGERAWSLHLVKPFCWEVPHSRGGRLQPSPRLSLGI